MKRLIFIVFVLISPHLFAQIMPEYISPVKIGQINLQTGKIFYQNLFNGNPDMQRLAKQFKSREQVYSVFNLNEVTSGEIKGTITNFQLNVDQYGVKRKKLASYLLRPLNASFRIEPAGGGYKVTVGNIWFDKFPGEKGPGMHHSLEALATTKNATQFLKDQKSQKSVAVIEKNLNELFSAAIGINPGF